jgi:hypothetical protein
MLEEETMRKSKLLFNSAVFCAISLLSFATAEAQVPGAPVGGTTGTGGNAGVGDHDAGADRTDTYDNPSNPMASTTSNGHHKPHHRAASDSVNPNNPTGNAPSGAIAPVPGAAGGAPAGASGTGR